MFRELRIAAARTRLLISRASVEWASPDERATSLRSAMQIIVSVVVLGVSLGGLVAPSVDEPTKKILAALGGSVVGFWLR